MNGATIVMTLAVGAALIALLLLLNHALSSMRIMTIMESVDKILGKWAGDNVLRIMEHMMNEIPEKLRGIKKQIDED